MNSSHMSISHKTLAASRVTAVPVASAISRSWYSVTAVAGKAKAARAFAYPAGSEPPIDHRTRVFV